MAINIQQTILGYGIGFSAPCLAQLVSLIIRMMKMMTLNNVLQVDEAILDENQLAWFASCLVIGQVM